MFAVAFALALAGGSAAKADTFSPASVTTRFAGALSVTHTISLTCSATLDITTSTTTTAAGVSSLNITGGLCGLISFNILPYPLDALTTTAIDIQNMRVSGFSTCGPDTVEVGWSPAQIITFSSAVIEPPVNCMILNGSLSRVSGPALTITP